MNYVGIDYHKKYSQVTAIDEEGRVIRSERRWEDGATILSLAGRQKIRRTGRVMSLWIGR